MKILIINYRYFVSGGPERYLFDVKEILEKEGHLVITFSVKSKKNVKSSYENYFVEPMGGQDESYFNRAKLTPRFLLDLISRLFYSFHVKRKLEKLISDKRPDVAYILHHYNKLSPSVIDACKKYNVPVVMRLSDYFLVCPQAHMINGNNNICEKCITNGYLSCIQNRCIKNSFAGSALKSFAMIFHRYILKPYDRVDYFICTNDFMKTKMIQSGFNSNKLTVIPTFKTKSCFEDVEIKDDKDTYILFFGRFSNEKAVDTLVYSYLKSKLFNKNIYLYLVGGKQEDLSLNLSEDEKKMFRKYCKVIGFVDEVIIGKYISDSLFVVHPSRWYENMPNTILEAFSYNKAVITANIGSLPCLVEDGRVGLLYEYENIDDLSLKLIELSNGIIRKKLENNIPEYFEQFNAERHYKDVMTIYNSAIKAVK